MFLNINLRRTCAVIILVQIFWRNHGQCLIKVRSEETGQPLLTFWREANAFNSKANNILLGNLQTRKCGDFRYSSSKWY